MSGGTVTPVNSARAPLKKGELDTFTPNLIFCTRGVLAAQGSRQRYGLSDGLRSVG